MIETSCSKKVAEKSVILKLSTNAHSESDKENTPDMIGNEKYNFLFGSDDIYSDYEGSDREEILSTDPNFTPTKNRSHDKNTNELTNVHQNRAIDKNSSEGFSMNNWKKGDSEVMSEFPFTGTPGYKVEIQDNTNKHCFLKRFLDEEIIAPLTLQTNKHVVDFIQANANKMLAFIALTYYMGIMKRFSNFILEY